MTCTTVLGACVQVRVHHFCSHLNKDVRQCILTDSGDRGARIIGIEYMISKELFEGLDPEEKKLWHSHDYEVHSGTLSTPGLPPVIANQDLKDVQNLYGALLRHLVHIVCTHDGQLVRLTVGIVDD